MFEVLYCHTKFGGVQTSHATVGTKNVESFLSVSVSITILIDRLWQNDFAQKVLELRSGFDIVGWGGCAPTFKFVSTELDGTTTGCQIWKCS